MNENEEVSQDNRTDEEKFTWKIVTMIGSIFRKELDEYYKDGYPDRGVEKERDIIKLVKDFYIDQVLDDTETYTTKPPEEYRDSLAWSQGYVEGRDEIIHLLEKKKEPVVSPFDKVMSLLILRSFKSWDKEILGDFATSGMINSKEDEIIAEWAINTAIDNIAKKIRAMEEESKPQ